MVAATLSGLLFILVVFAIFLACVGLLGDVLTVVYYTRVTLIAGTLLIAIAPLSIFGARNLLGNVFLLHNISQVAALTICSLLAAAFVFDEYRTIITNAVRFPDLVDSLHELAAAKVFGAFFTGHMKWYTICPWLLLVLPTPLLAIWYSSKSGDISLWQGLGGLVIGCVLYALLAVILSWIGSKCLPPESRLTGPFSTNWLFAVENQLPPRDAVESSGEHARAGASGYLYRYPHRDGRSFGPGHLQLGITALVCGLLYMLLIVYVTRFGDAPGPDNYLPTAFYAIALVVMLSSLLTGISFFCDKYHVPTSLVALVYCLVIYNVFSRVSSNQEHIFEIRDANPESRAPLPSISQVAKNRRIAIIVTAPGGGIHAAAWTARVLSGLTHRYPNFSDNLVGISATSGGSVGSMFFLEQLANPPPPGKKADVNARAQDSSLEAIAWGMGGPDLLRVILPFFVPSWDRGRALEQRWENLMEVDRKTKPLRLRDWVRLAASHEMPAVAFNSTEVETGRRIVFATARAAGDASANTPYRPMDFLGHFPDLDLDVPTAVRLSSSFPYVSPAAIAQRISSDGQRQKAGLQGLWHIVDGGYADNEGLVTAVEWVNELGDPKNPQQIVLEKLEKIVLIRINHAPETGLQDTKPAFVNTPFFNNTLGPINAMMEVRATSQQERGELESDLVEKRDTRKSITAVDIKFSMSDDDCKDEWLQPPLSWSLSAKQKAVYDRAWLLAEKTSFKTLDEILKPVPKP